MGMGEDLKEVYSDHMPKVERLQGCILVPTGIKIVDVPGEKIGETRKSFKYRLYRVKDIGQEITQDRAKFLADNFTKITTKEDMKLADITAEVEKETVKVNIGTAIKDMDIKP